jgi:metal-responsive CopG/Arc/MetJ family transcriptional regulator
MPSKPQPADNQQVPLRLPRELVQRIDARRAEVGEPSRNAWIERALRWALDQPHTPRPSTHLT